MADDAEQSPTPLAIAGPPDEPIGQHPADQTGRGAEQQWTARVNLAKDSVFRDLVLRLEEVGEVGDVEVPAIGRAEIHQAQAPEVGIQQQLFPGNTGMSMADVEPARFDQLSLREVYPGV